MYISNCEHSDCEDVKVTTDGMDGVYKVSPIKETSQLIAVEGKC